MKNLTSSELEKLRDAVYKIADARSAIQDINDAMKKEGRWAGQADIAAIVSSLDEVCEEGAGGIGYYLRTM